MNEYELVLSSSLHLYIGCIQISIIRLLGNIVYCSIEIVWLRIINLGADL